jgi:hypothetical protein
MPGKQLIPSHIGRIHCTALPDKQYPALLGSERLIEMAPVLSGPAGIRYERSPFLHEKNGNLRLLGFQILHRGKFV